MPTKRISATDTVQEAMRLAQVTQETGIGHVVRIPTPLDRAQYEAVDAFLSRFGGKWNRKLRGHVFPVGTDMKKIVGGVAATGAAEVEAEDFIPTPAEIAAMVIRHARIEAGMRVLEPSAGIGGIADEVVRQLNWKPADIDVFELNDQRRAVLAGKGYAVLGSNFLDYVSEPRWDRVVMNPPFLRSAWAAHVIHAFACLAPGGRLVAIVCENLSFSKDKAVQAFRADLLHPHGLLDEPLPADAFKASGTGVNTRLIVLKKPGEGSAAPRPTVPQPLAAAVTAPPAPAPRGPEPAEAPTAVEAADVVDPAKFAQLSLF